MFILGGGKKDPPGTQVLKNTLELLELKNILLAHKTGSILKIGFALSK